jgi:hypothetical protein
MHAREVFFVIGKDGAILWSDASGSPVALPDSRARWERIWELRDSICELAHSHPIGPLAFSHEDETTMAALVSALGRPIVFSVVAPGGMIRSQLENDGAVPAPMPEPVLEEPWWTSLLRAASGMTKETPHVDAEHHV